MIAPRPHKPLLAAALDYAARGWSVIPLRPGEKLPSCPWKAYTQRRATSAEITRWWTERGNLNVGVVCGRISGLFVLDVDPKNGGFESLAALEATHGALDRSRVVRTPSGGLHFYFRHPGDRDIPNSVGELGPGLDIRGERGYVVAPPSVNKLTGRDYRWIR